MKIFRNLAIIFGCLAVAVFAAPQYTNPSNPNYGTNKIGQCYAGSLNNWVGIANTSANLTNYAIQCDAQGNLVAPYLPLAGGTAMTGAASLLLSTNVNNVQYAEWYPGADLSIKIANALVAAGQVSLDSADIYAYVNGSATFGTNPFGYAGVSGVNYPLTGTLHLCGVGQINVRTPITKPGTPWNIEGCGSGLAGGSNSVFLVAEGGQFPATYSTGTVTVGSAGASSVATFSGSTLIGNMNGCQLIANPGNANSSWGIIQQGGVTSATSATIGWLTNTGSGAPAASPYNITCAVLQLGDGEEAGSPDQYTGDSSHFAISCNNIAGCVGIRNNYSEEGTTASDFEIFGYTNIGIDWESGNAQNSGPITKFTLFPGSSCTASTISIVSRIGTAGMKPFQNGSINNSYCSTKLSVAVDDQSSGVAFLDLHFENAAIGISVGANTSCPVACPIAPGAVSAPDIERIWGAVSGTTLVTLSNANGNIFGATIKNINNITSWTNTLIDAQNSCTETNPHLGTYELAASPGGAVQNSSSVTPGCQATPTQGQTILRSFAANSNSPYLGFLGNYNGTSADQLHVLLQNESSNSAPYTYLNFAHVAGSANFQGYHFDQLIVHSTVFSAAGAALPACNGNPTPYGSQAIVSDATTPVYGTAYTSGGAVYAQVTCTPSGWLTF